MRTRRCWRRPRSPWVATDPLGDAHVAVTVAGGGPQDRAGTAAATLRQARRGGSKAGHGLGLAICKGQVEAHGERIRAESAGRGVIFALPVAG